ncbi:hypothetical protein IFM89_023473 [Coptis chinensis]|uniref:Uncharacterized protein n=1 Tax=Coptis chinensis TaxID=261450 RepID=A0A835HJF9_9MAGN|nr:hypothetical protein IFM89_023473 [Coptis chinensis]
MILDTTKWALYCIGFSSFPCKWRVLAMPEPYLVIIILKITDTFCCNLMVYSYTNANQQLQGKQQYASRSYSGDSGLKTRYIAASSGPWFGSRKSRKGNKLGLFTLAAESNQVARNPTDNDSAAGITLTDDQLLGAKPPTVTSSGTAVTDESIARSQLGTQKSQTYNGAGVPSDVKVDTVSSSKSVKRSSLTAREKLRAARVLSRTDSKPSKSEFGSKVLDALRESERGKKRSRLPEAPTNLLDDSKRGMPKQGLTFDFPGGFDLFVIVLSFVLITTTMVATTYIVWKLGAIHFNEN